MGVSAVACACPLNLPCFNVQCATARRVCVGVSVLLLHPPVRWDHHLLSILMGSVWCRCACVGSQGDDKWTHGCALFGAPPPVASGPCDICWRVCVVTELCVGQRLSQRGWGHWLVVCLQHRNNTRCACTHPVLRELYCSQGHQWSSGVWRFMFGQHLLSRAVFALQPAFAVNDSERQLRMTRVPPPMGCAS